MGFENTRMGMKFYNMDFPTLVKNIGEVASELKKLNESRTPSNDELNESRKSSNDELYYKYLLDKIVNSVLLGENRKTKIITLLKIGFDKDDLVNNFAFNPDEVDECITELTPSF